MSNINEVVANNPLGTVEAATVAAKIMCMSAEFAQITLTRGVPTPAQGLSPKDLVFLGQSSYHTSPWIVLRVNKKSVSVYPYDQSPDAYHVHRTDAPYDNTLYKLTDEATAFYRLCAHHKAVVCLVADLGLPVVRELLGEDSSWEPPTDSPLARTLRYRVNNDALARLASDFTNRTAIPCELQSVDFKCAEAFLAAVSDAVDTLPLPPINVKSGVWTGGGMIHHRQEDGQTTLFINPFTLGFECVEHDRDTHRPHNFSLGADGYKLVYDPEEIRECTWRNCFEIIGTAGGELGERLKAWTLKHMDALMVNPHSNLGGPAPRAAVANVLSQVFFPVDNPRFTSPEAEAELLRILGLKEAA